MPYNRDRDLQFVFQSDHPNYFGLPKLEIYFFPTATPGVWLAEFVDNMSWSLAVLNGNYPLHKLSYPENYNFEDVIEALQQRYPEACIDYFNTMDEWAMAWFEFRQEAGLPVGDI